MAAFGSQHRRVFVGNIPYDATEEQLIQICEEVGPVVSFRLVLDRETGKPRGYGFCEYRDEETALSALRNLQGCEMNGRRLRVNFAENDNKPQAGAPIVGDSSLHQPLGLPVAANAASLMANSLSAVPNGVQNMAGLGNDPLTHHLARMSRHQLYERLSEIKTIATQNKDVARQLLQGHPQLLKALFQAELMLGMVPPPMVANKGPSSSSVLQPSLQDNVMGQNSVLQSGLGQTPLQKEALTQMSNALHSPVNLQQHAPVQLQFQHALPPQPQNLQHGAILNESGIPIQPQSLGDLSNQPLAPLPASAPLISQVQPSILPNVGHHPQLVLPNASLQQSFLPHSQAGASNNPVLLNGQGMLSKEAGNSASLSNDTSWESRMGKHVGLTEKTGMTGDMSELTNHGSKRPRLEGGAHFLMSSSSCGISSHPTQSMSTGLAPGSQTTNADSSQHSEKQVPQFPPDVESSLLQQVMNLKPEQLGSLPLEQQQQVLQLQQMLTLKQKVISVV